MRHRYLRASVALVQFFCLLAQFTLPSSAQRSAIATYAITNARIFPVNSPMIERGTVVMRNGLIVAVGPQVTAPADARVIDGTGLSVYPGLIDANTTLGIPEPSASPAATGGAGRGGAGGAVPALAQTPQPTLAAAAFSPNMNIPGLKPETLASDLIQPGGTPIENARSAGITSALVAPRDGIFIGQSAFINLAGDTSEQMIVRSPVALHVGFTPLRGGTYPASLMGVFAALRQMLMDAQRLHDANEIYARNPRGLRRPEQNKSLEALYPVLARQMPVIMHVGTEREIERALDLAKEFNLRIIISGGAESWKMTDKLKDVPVLLSLNFPKRTTAQVPEADPEPLRVLRERVDAPKTAGRLAAAHVRFAFQSGAMTNISDYLANAAKAVENGLPRDEALRALTINAAEILGVSDRLGTIEPGKIANLTVTRGDIFDRNARITNVFIDGQPVDLKPVTPAGTGGGGGRLASGTWTLSVKLEEGEQAITLILQQEGENLRGSIQGALGSAQIANASISPSGELRFTVPVTTGGQTHEATFTGTITGNEMRGTVEVVGRQPGTFTGTRPASGGAAPTRTPSNTTTSTPPSANTDLSGTWALSIAVGGQTVSGTLMLQQQGQTLSGTLKSPFGSTELSNGSVADDGFHFTSTAEVEGRKVEIAVNGTVNGNEMSGTVTSEIGSTTFTGTKPKSSDR